MKKTGTVAGILSHGMAIYAAYRTSQPPDYRTYSPEVTSLRSNLPVHRSVCAWKGFHHADLIIISDIQRNVKTFFSVFHSFFEIFLAVRGCTRQRGKCPPPGHFPLRYLIPDQAASASYNHVSVRCKEHRDAIHPGVPYYICPQIPSLAFSAEIIFWYSPSVRYTGSGLVMAKAPPNSKPPSYLGTIWKCRWGFVSPKEPRFSFVAAPQLLDWRRWP